MIKKDVIIIGAGASGLMCAITAARRGRKVIVLERTGRIGNKIRISGGGRCNFTNLNMDAEHYISSNPDFCKSALSRFTPDDIIRMVRKHHIQYYEKEDGQLFCVDSSMDIVNMLQRECKESGVEFRFLCNIKEVKKTDIFTVVTEKEIFNAGSLVISTGGLSHPETGATGIGYEIAKTFGISVTECRPGLVPFKFSRKDLEIFMELSGVSIETIIDCKGKKFRGNILFTHRGLSGPAILKASLWWTPGAIISINLMPEFGVFEFLLQNRKSKKEIHNVLSKVLPVRFAHIWCRINTEIKPICQYTEKELRVIADRLQNWIVRPDGTEGYRVAEVTIGGIDTDELSSKNMESKKIQGLYFTGEVMDVTGELGGYNLHWAWASGHVAGLYV